MKTDKRGPQMRTSGTNRLTGLNWRRPLFYVLLPVFFVMAFLGFPIPVTPPLATKPGQEQSVPEK